MSLRRTTAPHTCSRKRKRSLSSRRDATNSLLARVKWAMCACRRKQKRISKRKTAKSCCSRPPDAIQVFNKSHAKKIGLFHVGCKRMGGTRPAETRCLIVTTRCNAFQVCGRQAGAGAPRTGPHGAAVPDGSGQRAESRVIVNGSDLRMASVYGIIFLFGAGQASAEYLLSPVLKLDGSKNLVDRQHF